MSVFVPPLSLKLFEQFLIDIDDPNDISGYRTFRQNAKNTTTEASIQTELDSNLNELKALAINKHSEISKIIGEKLRDDGNFLGFRMAMRISEKIEVAPMKIGKPLNIKFDDGYVLWNTFNGTQPTSLNAGNNQFGNEILRQNTDGDLFIILYFLEHHSKTWPIPQPFEKDSLIWQIFSVWNALQLPLAQVIFNTKSLHHKIDRPYKKGHNVFPSNLPLPTHSSYPSGHAAGAGALAGLIYWLLVTAQLNGSTVTNAPETYIKVAYRVGLLREYAHLHWTKDTADGFLLGMRFVRGALTVALQNPQNGRLADFAWLLAQCLGKIKA